MSIFSLEELLQLCHQRHEKPMRQRKIVAMPTVYTKNYPHQYKVYCARQYPVMLHDLEQADISFMPIGRAPEHDQGPGSLERDPRFLERQGTNDWQLRRWDVSWGIQIYTGVPSERESARWHDLHFKYEALCAAPDAVLTCIDTLINIVENPLLTLGKSGGLRFTCRVQDYLHSDTEQSKLYIYKDAPTLEHPHQRDVYLEVLGENGYSRWDARYEILLGDLLTPPVIDKDVLFAPIDALRAKLHQPASSELIETTPKMPMTFGSRDLDLAKDAFLKRGFSYVRQENESHYWKHPNNTPEDAEVSLWESDGIIWVRASTPDIGLPTTSTPIVDLWDDTGVLPPMSETRTPISAEILHIREEGLSPLAIKRPPPVLKQQDQAEKNEILEKNASQIQSIFDRGVRILSVISGIGPWNTQTEEMYFRHDDTICLNLQPRFVEAAEKYFQGQETPSVVRWKPRTYRWETVKDIPVEERMENPFQGGNVCEDPERSAALEEKGGDPNESICPQCAVYAECQERGYLSQFAELQQAKVQMLTIPKLFFDPQHAELVEEILKQENNTERLCVVNIPRAHQLFLECKLPKSILEAWVTEWNGYALGNFAKTLLSALEIKGKRYVDAIRGVRAVMQTFEWQEESLIQQMSQVKVQGRVVEQGFTDPDTGKVIARATIEFEGGISAYIPLDTNAMDALKAKGLPVFPFRSYPLNEDLKVMMPMAQAIELGILDTETVESIQEFPTVSLKQDWTFWHQLKRFFAHYTRDADAPIRWDDEALQFWVPPVLHPSVKRLLLISPVISEQHLQRVFPDEAVETHRTEPIPWIAGNRVFQIRTGFYPSEMILDYHNWGCVGVSKMGQRFLLGIHSEVVKDRNVKHGIITNRKIARRLEDIEKRRNVCFVDTFQKTRMSDALPEEADVIWIVGTPRQPKSLIWRWAQTLFGNDVEPFSYEEEIESGTYKDPRIQSILEEHVANLLAEIIVKAELDRLADKKVVLITGLPLPNITNRPETSIFDWEDFEIAGGLDELPEMITTRERFEQEREQLTAETSRREVERILGCSSRQANRVLNKLRGGNIPRIPIRQQILTLLDDGEKKAAELIAAIEAHPEAIHHELARLLSENRIVRVRRGWYDLPKKV